MSRESRLLCVVLLVFSFLVFPELVLAADRSARCEALVERAAGRYSRCLLHAESRNTRRPKAVRLQRARDRCASRFHRKVESTVKFLGAESCTPYTPQIADRTVSYAENVAKEAGGMAVASRLYVQGSLGGSLDETRLVLSDVDFYTGWYADAPYEKAGRMPTEAHVALFSPDSPNSFAVEPPKADFICDVDGVPTSHAVILSEPVFSGGSLSYAVSHVRPTAGEDSFTPITCEGDAHLFIATAGPFTGTQWNPKKRYVMVTFDDGLPISSLEQVVLLLFPGCQDNGMGSATDLPTCVKRPRRMNHDQSLVRMTYFATAGFSGNFANLDYWASLGNEVANHTVTHINGWGGQDAVSGTCPPAPQPCVVPPYNGAYTEARWKNEMLDMVGILKHWTDITEHQDMAGFRAPQLFLNYTIFDGLDQYLSALGPGGLNAYYDSNLKYDLKTNPIQPPKLLNRENFCVGEDLAPVLKPLTAPYQDCTQLIPAQFANAIWELPLPLYTENLMELPAVLNDLDTYLDKQQNSDGSYTPLLISLHTAELSKHPEFQDWMQRAIDNHQANFVTVGEVINMYASEADVVAKPAQYAISDSCLNGSVLTGSPRKCTSQFADSRVDGVARKDPYCNLNCDEAEYGEGCYFHSGSPDGAGGFSTCNETCAASTAGGSLPAGYMPGAYPWLGNAAGNTQRNDGSSADSCDYFPKTVPAAAP